MLGFAYRRVHHVLRRHTDLWYNQHRSAYIVLLPEVDPELADKLLSINVELPAFSKITTAKIGTLVGKNIVDYECIVRNADRKLEESPKLYPDLFEDILDPLEKTISSFDTVWGIFRTLYLVDKTKVPQTTYFSLAQRGQNARNILYNAEFIYKKCKECDKSQLTEEQARFVDKIVVEGRLNALDATPKFRSVNLVESGKLKEKQTYFRLRVEAARAQFFLTLDDPFLLQEVPRYLLKMMSHAGGGSVDGPWTVKLHYNIGEKFLEYCPDRNIRFMIWHAEDKAGSISEEVRELANSVCLEEIRYARYEIANSAGFKSHVEANMLTKMAGSVENVENTLDMLLKAAKPAQLEEIVKLQEYAESNKFEHPIQLWDIPYWSRKQKMSLYNFDDELLRNYLPFDRVLSGLFSLCSRLFGIRFQEVQEFDSWHPDVKFYYIYEPDSEKPVAGFYLDPYSRDTKLKASSQQVYLSVIRNSSRIPRPVMPLTVLIMQFEPPTDKHPCLLSFTETQALFSKFGHNLQYLLNKSSYTDVAGLNYVEYDAVSICSQFMANWLYDQNTFASISAHYETGAKSPAIDLEGLRKHLAGFRLCKEMFKAKLDIQMHKKHEIFWLDLARDLWDDYYIFPISAYFSDPCRYLDIFADCWGGAYYSHLWSEMLAADIYLAFAEEKDDASVGARFRDTFLTFGGSCHSREVFRRFRGRDPEPSMLLRHLGLTQGEKTEAQDDRPTVDPKVVATTC